MKIINNQNTLKKKLRNNYWLLVARRSLGYWLFLLLLFSFSCSDSTSTEEDETGGDGSSARVEGVVNDGKVELNYADGFIYGTVKAEEDGVAVNNASFAIINSDAPNDEITIDVATGAITIARGLVEGEYSFTVQVTIPSTEGGRPEIITINEKITITPKTIMAINPRTIKEADFTIPPSSVTEKFNYTNTSFGTITANAGVTADFSIVNVNPPTDKITIDGNGEIRVAAGLGNGTYSFSVKVSGKDNYMGEFTLSFTFNVTREITENDYTLPFLANQTRTFGYAPFTYGKITLNPGVMADFINVNSNLRPIMVSANGEITVASGLIPATYNFQVQITGKGNYFGSLLVDFSLTIESPPFINTFNISDNNDGGNEGAYLEGATSVATTQISGFIYLFTAANADNALTVHRINNVGRVTFYRSLQDANAFNFTGNLAVTTIGSTPYVFTTTRFPNAVVGFRFSTNGELERYTTITAQNTPGILSGSLRGVTIAEINGKHYLFVASYLAGGVQVFEVAQNDGTLTPVTNITDGNNNDFKLQGAENLVVAEVGGTHYLFVSGSLENGISTFALNFSANNNLILENRANVTDDDTLNLEGVTHITTATINNTTYLFTFSYTDNGISVFTVADSGNLTPRYNVGKDDPLLSDLSEPGGIVASVIDGTMYVLFTGGATDNVKMAKLEDSNSSIRLSEVFTINDDSTLKLAEPREITTAVIGGGTYLFVTGYEDNGVSIFLVEP